jgi:tRNA pseudouridine38-40 synthase
MNIKVTISYDGRRYNGFQRQKNAVGVQNVIESALLKLIGENVSIEGCSRTDTGVHARAFVFTFRTDVKIPPDRLVTGLNHFLPFDIAASAAQIVPDDFHARYSCKGKAYEYLLYSSKLRNPFYDRLALCYGVPITDLGALNAAGKVLIGTHDFRSFCGSKGLSDNTTRTVFDFDIKKCDENLFVFSVSGDGFLYNMVRIIVGTLLEINEGKRAPDCMESILAARDRKCAGRTAPAEGLYLSKVFY